MAGNNLQMTSVLIHDTVPSSSMNHGYDNYDYDNESKLQLQNIDTVFGEAMDLKIAFDEEEEINIYQPMNKRLSIYWAHLWIIFILYLIGGGLTESVIAIVYCTLELIFNITVLIIAFIRKYKNKNDMNTLYEHLNIILGISKKDEKNIYNLAQISGTYIGLIFVSLAINMCLVMIINRSYSIYLDRKGGFEFCDECLVLVGSNMMFLFSMGVMLAMLTLQFYTIKDRIVVKMLKFKDDKILTIKDNKIGGNLNDKIYDKALKKWQNKLLFKNRKKEFCIFFIFAVLFIFVGYPFPEKSLFHNIYYIWTAGSAAIAGSILFYIFMSSAKYFSYPKIVMRKFTNPIEGDNIEDFVLWWQFRRYYLENDAQINGRVINIILTITFTVSLICLAGTLRYLWIGDRNADTSYTKVTFMIMLLFGLILYLAQNASSFYEEQLKHKSMLIREKLRIKGKIAKNIGKDDGKKNTKEMNNELIGFIDFMIKDIETTVIAIEMCGIKITPNIMTLIKGYVASGFIAVTASLF